MGVREGAGTRSAGHLMNINLSTYAGFPLSEVKT